MSPTTPEPRKPGNNPLDRDYETEVRLARNVAELKRRAAKNAYGEAVAKADAALSETLAQIDRTEQAQIANAKRRHGKEAE